MEFAGLDDELFEAERQRGLPDEEYSARYCDDRWFLDVEPDDLVSKEDTLNVQKFTAEYFFLIKDFDRAIAKYKDILSSMPTGNVITKRECCEGIARSHLKKGTPDEAIEYAKTLHETSKTVEQATASCSVLVDVYFGAGMYKDALLAAQELVTLHTLNSDTWLKLACIYAALHCVNIPNVLQLLQGTRPSKNVIESKDIDNKHSERGNVSPEKDLSQEKSLLDMTNLVENENITAGVHFVAICLLRSFILLKKTEGTAIGFAAEFNILYQKKILQDLNKMLDKASLQQLKQQVLKSGDMEKMSGRTQEISDFVDRGSSKFKSEENDSSFELISQQNFESRWFSWVSSS